MVRPRKRILIDRPGGYRRLRFDETPLDDLPEGQVQVEIRACGINFADIAVRLGLYKAAKGLYPLCPGLEFSGVVTDLGQGVEGFQAGDRVMGVSRFGAYTTHIHCPAEHLWRLPTNWNFARGASFPVVYLTAFHALFHVGHLKDKDKVLVHSAAGGVGTALLHLLRINGNFSVGVVGSSRKVEAARTAGAKEVIDKGAHGLWDAARQIAPEGYDLILDANGASTLKESYCHLAPGGRLLVYGFASMFSHSGRKNLARLIWYFFRTPRFSPFDLTGANKTVSGFNLIYLFSKVSVFRDDMETLLRWDAEGRLPAMPITLFPFDKVAEAHRALEAGGTVGKLVLLTS